MLKRNLAWLLLLTAACGKAPVQSAELVPFIHQFQDQYGAYDINAFQVDAILTDKLSIDLPALPGSIVVGECDGLSKIELLRSTWNIFTEQEKKTTIFHELGHCVFKRSHTSDVYPDGCPKSIMNPSVVPDECFAAHGIELYAELPIHLH